ncbi:AAA family ATPase [Phorcysia thermohydrogeniphila]|uniref:Flagellar biosynthesis protein FlhG n=1 Tax=Phorcysia thermohydrogeniphila TaxID=936138 RepID=A0A4R1GDW1_9BACT|nr:AAA family ATPase [Phorcysia thermohydrogeniphila]TCK03889.1 flagellar biosynthesis protein FlhG [Phorcysia thermohydrogeniphila]
MSSQAENLLRLIKSKENLSGKAKVLSFASGKGGVGKTGVSVSMAYVLANLFDKKVLLLDCDIGLGNVHILLGLEPNKNLKAVLEGAHIREVIQPVYNFDVVLGFSGIDSIDDLESADTANLFLQLEEVISEYDYVLIDNSAGLNRHTIGFSRVATTTYIITTPEPTALTDAYAFIKSLYKLYGYSSFKVVVNMCQTRSEGFETFERLQFSAKNFLGISLKLAGVLPRSRNVARSLRGKALVVKDYPSDPYSVEIRKIAQLETGEALPEEKEGFIARLLRILREGV